MNIWAPLKLFRKHPACMAILRVGFVNRILVIVNALARMRAGKGVRIVKAVGGWVIEADVANLDDGLAVRWLKICKDVDGTTQELWIKVRCSELYADSAGVPGAVIPGNPYTDYPVT